ncbi:MAG TPA: Calx-beta domain-containing protein [Allosphingosinicella sp.]
MVYQYDALGRLITTTSTINDAAAVQTDIRYDPAGNRSTFVVGGATGPSGPSGTDPTVPGGSFEVPEVGASHNFDLTNTASGVSFDGHAGIAGNGSALGLPAAPDGDQVGVLHGWYGVGGLIRVPLGGLSPGVSYKASFLIARPPNTEINPVKVSVGDTVIGNYTSVPTAFTEVATNAFTADANGNALLTFTGGVPSQGGIGTITGIDKISVAPTTAATPTVSGGSFETPDKGTGGMAYEYRPTAAFAGNTGIAANGSNWSFAAAPDGDQVAFVQGGGEPAIISLPVTGLTSGARYVVSFRFGARPGYTGIPVTVKFNGADLGAQQPETATFVPKTSAAFTASGSSGTLTFEATGSPYHASGLDMVSIAPASGGGTTPPPQPPAFHIMGSEVNEGQTAQFVVSRSTTAGRYTVDYATSHVSTDSNDYTPKSGTLVFEEGQKTQTILIPVIADGVEETWERMLVTLSNPSGGATFSERQAGGLINPSTGTTTPPPPPTSAPPSFSIKTAGSADEGSNLIFYVERSGNLSGSFSVNYATSNGSAMAGTDYDATSGPLLFTEGQTIRTINVLAHSDNVAEPEETLAVTLSAPTGGATIAGTGQATGRINASGYTPPPAGNQPPVANADSFTMSRCRSALIPVLNNDTDPENTALTLVSVSYSGQLGAASVSGNSVSFAPNNNRGATTVVYTMKDANGAQASAVLNLEIVDGRCGTTDPDGPDKGIT